MAQHFKVVFRTWDLREYYVLAKDEDDAMDEAEQELLLDLRENEEYECMDVYFYEESSRDPE